MERIFRFLIYLSALLLLTTNVFAKSGWTDYVPVTELMPTTDGRYLVKLKVIKNPSGCRNNETCYQDYSVLGSTQIFHTLLAAVASEKKVRAYVTGNCELYGYSEISSVSIAP